MTGQMYSRLNFYYDISELDCKYSIGSHTEHVDGHKVTYRRFDSGSDVILFFLGHSILYIKKGQLCCNLML